MAEQQVVDITQFAVLGEQFPLRLMQLGFRLMQVMDGTGHDQYRFVLPPVCAVPAGPFLMGSDKHKDHLAKVGELPQHTVTLSTYFIATYPLTVAEYTYYQVPPAGGFWKRQQHQLDHPVVYITWEEAQDYARWLAQATGEDWRLPTEAEWEKAARGTDGRIYPWGDHWSQGRANVGRSGPSTITPVGSYPRGASPYGVQDMAGNVWELTSTILTPYLDSSWASDYWTSVRRTIDIRALARHIVSPPAPKSMRGGSYTHRTPLARAAYRGSYSPPEDFEYIGVRLVRGGGAG